MNEIAIADYDGDNEVELQDPTALTEEVDKAFMNKLAKTLTRFEDVLAVGQADLNLNDIHRFIDARGEALDQLDDLEIAEWLNHMRKTARCPFRRFTIDG